MKTDKGNFNQTQAPQRYAFPTALDDKQKRVSFFRGPSQSSPELGYFIFDNALIYSPNGWILSEDDILQLRCSWYVDSPQRFSSSITPNRDGALWLKGTTLSIASDYSGTNYGHFLLDSLSRLSLLGGDKSIVIKELDHIAISGPKKEWKEKLLLACDIPLEKVIWLSSKQQYTCEKLLATSMPSRLNTYPKWITSFLRSKLLQKTELDSGSLRKRYYISRQQGARALSNDQQIFEIASAFGYERYEPSLSENSIIDFSRAEAVIAPHGAALTDTMFMSQNSLVIELMPSDHKYCYFYTIAQAQNLNYHVLIGDSEGKHHRLNSYPSEYDFSIDPERFLSLLQQQHP
ncbi:glycosyltransferase family 61 protein [Alginatibacterium sediminis]|uniref:glycosyltransferase family 61 protein n=1 Tax=Alginatibacterium sediminis TaxID=2164068 RepID=UPI0013142E19|nr:glycosyltransferase family 61 protein [Alginatibacterium sediminis]